MPSPRSEALAKKRSEAPHIRSVGEYSLIDNKIDHYAVLATILEDGVREYLGTPETTSHLYDIPTLQQLAVQLQEDVKNTCIEALESDSFKESFSQLHSSMTERKQADLVPWDSVAKSIAAGAVTFMKTFDHCFALLQRHFGLEVASHPGSWRLAFDISKLGLFQASAYSNMYLSSHQNWALTVDHVEITEDGYAQFRDGFPDNAIVRVSAQHLAKPLTEEELRGNNPSQLFLGARLNEIDPSRDVGCPVSLTPKSIRDLWSLYTHHAERIITTPAISSGDNEASHRQTFEPSPRLYRQLARSMPLTHLEHPTHQSDR